MNGGGRMSAAGSRSCPVFFNALTSPSLVGIGWEFAGSVAERPAVTTRQPVAVARKSSHQRHSARRLHPGYTLGVDHKIAGDRYRLSVDR